jgi:hypothetical protein
LAIVAISSNMSLLSWAMAFKNVLVLAFLRAPTYIYHSRSHFLTSHIISTHFHPVHSGKFVFLVAYVSILSSKNDSGTEASRNVQTLLKSSTPIFDFHPGRLFKVSHHRNLTATIPSRESSSHRRYGSQPNENTVTYL